MVTHSYQSRLFLSLVIFLAGFFAVKIWNIQLLYTNATVPNQVEESLRLYADKEGLLLSELEVQRVSQFATEVRVREYLRGIDPMHCVRLQFEGTSFAIPCVD